MTSKISFCVAILACVSMITSCLKGGDETTTYGDTAITSMYIGNVKCTRTVKSSRGTDSTYTYTYSASKYRVMVDNNSCTIYNRDSLPVGSHMDKLLLNVYTKNYGSVYIKNLDSETYTYVSSSDSLDFSNSVTTPRILRVVSSNGQNYRDYKVTLVAHKEGADSMSWSQRPVCEYAKAYTRMQAAQAADRLFILGFTEDGNGAITAQQLISTTDAYSWKVATLPAALTTDKQSSITAFDKKLYLLNDGTLYVSADGETWNSVVPTAALKCVLGGCNGELYATGTNNEILLSKDNGTTWTVDQATGAGVKLPDHDISTIVTTQSTNSEVGLITVIGNTSEASDTTAVVWNKYVDADSPQKWIYTRFGEENKKYRLPDMKNISATIYGDSIFAIGGAGTKTSDNYDKIYYSPDNGLTWHTKAKQYQMPSAFSVSTSAIVTTYVDADDRTNDRMVFIAGGTGMVYVCRINVLSWKKKQEYYQ